MPSGCRAKCCPSSRRRRRDPAPSATSSQRVCSCQRSPLRSSLLPDTSQRPSLADARPRACQPCSSSTPAACSCATSRASNWRRGSAWAIDSHDSRGPCAARRWAAAAPSAQTRRCRWPAEGCAAAAAASSRQSPPAATAQRCVAAADHRRSCRVGTSRSRARAPQGRAASSAWRPWRRPVLHRRSEWACRCVGSKRPQHRERLGNCSSSSQQRSSLHSGATVTGRVSIMSANSRVRIATSSVHNTDMNPSTISRVTRSFNLATSYHGSHLKPAQALSPVRS